MPDNHYSEREKLVIDLYKNQNKSIRDIAKTAKMSFRDIGFILKKEGLSHGITIDNDDSNKKSNSNNNEKATQAYKLFSEGKSLIQVSVELGLREKVVSRFFMEFLKLKREYRLYQLYREIGPSLSSFLKLHKALKKRGLKPDNVEWFAEAIKMGVELPELEAEYQNLQNNVWGIQHQKQELERDYQAVQKQIMELTDTHNTLQRNFDVLAENVDDLYNEKDRLERFVARYKNTNRKYLEIRGIAEEIVNRLFAEQGALLNSVIIAVIGAIRVNPDKYAIFLTIVMNTMKDYSR